MNLVRTEQRVRLVCLSEPHMIETLDMDQLVDELADGSPPGFLTPERLCVQDLVVIAIDERSGRHLGLLGARDEQAGEQPYLRLDMACVAPKARGRRLVSRLVARAAADRAGRAPILAACTATPAWFHALRHFANTTPDAHLHPAPSGAVVALRTAGLARQIAATLCPEHRYDMATGVLHGKWTMPAGALRRHASAEAWCEAMRDPAPSPSERLLAVIDLHDVGRATLLARARESASGEFASDEFASAG
jgi:hypothetical protein